MTRAALLPAGPDPFMIAYWLRHYSRVWAGEVDELVVYACGVTRDDVTAYLHTLADGAPHTRLYVDARRVDHGAVLGRLMDLTDASHVLLCEDDAFIRQAGVVDAMFGRLERGETDALGVPRGSASMSLIEAARDRWGEPVATSTGESGWSLYPCCFFGRRADLLATDRNYAARAFAPGETIPGLGIQSAGDTAADTFASTAWQLRAAGLRIAHEPGYRTDRAKMGEWGAAPWFHVGSLSTGYGNTFLVDSDAYRAGLASVSGQTYDQAKRCAWWQRAWERWDGGIPEHHAEYGAALTQFMADAGISPGEVADWRSAFAHLITWDERP